MLWITLLATASLALGEVEIITSPTPGNEYVKISGSPQDAANLTEPKVQIKDEGLSGLQHKPYPIKKAEHIPLKKDVLSVKATVKDEGLSGVVKKTSGIGVPPLKHMDDTKFEVLSRKNKRDDGGLDFDDDLPLSDKKLKPSGTSQSSRINVKKGPNGQEYEYEYVYYYYDDEDDSAGSSSTAEPASPSRGQSTSRKPISEPSEEPRTRGELVKQKNVESGQEPPRSRGESDHRGGHRVVEVEEEVEEEQSQRRRTEPRTDDRSKNRYTTIERGSSGGRGRDPVAVTTAEPQLNEVLPSRGNQRTRGRQVEAAVIEDERLPANTRFPSRGRGSSVATTIPPQPSAQTQPSRTRGQGNGATIRRPSLVDSSSFRTHSSDAAPDADLDKNYYRASPVQDTRESDLEEYIQPELVRPTTFVPAQTTTPPPPAPLPEQPEEGNMPDKAAHDLYAILQQQQEENSVSGIGGSEEDTFSPTEVATTAEPTTVTTTTTTTTTTEAPTTTTTTTTTTTPPPPPPPPAAGRGRFRGGSGARARVRPGGAVSTTTTEAAPQEEETTRRKFAPSHGGRSPGQVSAYGRRGSGARATTTTAAPAQEQEASSTARSRASFGANSGNNRYRARGRTTAATSAPQEDEATPETETTSAATTHSRPTRPRLNVSAATRPLRPGPRINLRGRGGISTPAPTPAPAPAEEEPSPVPVTSPPPAPVEEEASPSPVAPSDALSRLRNRPRLKVAPRQPGAPSASSPRPLPQGFRRPGRPLSQQATPAPEEPVPAPTEPTPAQTEAPAQVADPAPTEPPPPPHLARRRPAIRRLQIPHQQ